MKKLMYYISAIITGALVPLAFAPLNIWPVAILSLTILAYIWSKQSAKDAFKTGFCFGFGMFGVGVSWVYVSIHDFGYTSEFLAVILTVLFVAVLALFTAINGFVLKKLFKGYGIRYALIGFPCIWFLSELLISVFLTGFPWLLIGYTQVDGPLIGFAPLVGVYGISFLLAFTAGILYLFCFYLLKARDNYIRIACFVSILALVWVTGFYIKDKQWTKEYGDDISVAILQANINPDDKFLLKDPIATVDASYGQMTRENLEADLIIWPENSLPLPYPRSKFYLDYIQNLVTTNNAALMLGMPVEAEINHKYYNSIVAINGDYNMYFKKNLVPFGEFVPLENLIRGLIDFFDLPMSDFIPGKDDNPNILPTKYSRALSLVCYEVAYGIDIQNSIKSNTDVLVTISEDGWFGNSWGPHQHFDIARMRALETGRYLLRATTSGISAIIGPNGNVIAKSEQFRPEVLKGKYKNISGRTPWTKVGILPLLGFILLLLAIGLSRKKY